ncbi:MAG: 50S ribosomal protein L13 [Planctomycetota bacterium]|nr:50S ribosomal protein L13 [Planctomycetota bacterium]
MRQTTFVKSHEPFAGRVWRHVDADGKRLGRLATEIATVLMGKHRPTYTPHVDTGDFVIVTNAEKIVMTGRKAEQATRTRYTGYPGGLYTTTLGQLRENKPEELIEVAVRRMLPKGRLGRQMLTKLRVFKGPSHPHAAQQPIPLEV